MAIAAGAIGLFSWNIFQQSGKPSLAGPKPVPLTIKSGTPGYVRQHISANEGGTFETPQVTVALPTKFTSQDVVVSYRQITSQKLSANHAVGGMFELTATTKEGNSVRTFDQALTLSIPIAPEQLEGVSKNKLSVYFFDVSANKWEAIPSTFDSQTNQLIATTTHFTTFVVAANDPNQGSTTQSAESPFIVDDSDPEPYFVPGGQTDENQPSFWEQVGSGYNGNALYTGNSVNQTAHNWATWSALEGLNGEVEVIATIPEVAGYQLTTGAVYTVAHAGGSTTVVVDQAAHAGGTVSLGTFTFNGSGSVYLSDVVSEQGGFFQSVIVFDAISFGADLTNIDLNPPKISDVRAFSDNGVFRINALITDAESGVASAYLVMNGQAYQMESMGNDRFALSLPVPKNSTLEYSIVAYDQANNEGVWVPGRGQITRGSFYRLTGYHAGMIHNAESTCNTQYGCPGSDPTNSQIVGHPVNTVNGNLIEEIDLVEIGGRPAFSFGLTYNSQAGRPSIFGQNWTHSYNYHALEISTPEKSAVYLQYPDGKVVTFINNNGTYTAEPGYFDTLEQTGSGFTLTQKDLTQLTFDADGDLIRYQDANGNGLTFTYDTKDAHTLLSALTTITADSGRSLQFTYNDQGLVESITAPEEKTLSFSYSNQDDLTSWTDANGGTTTYTYNNHHLTQATTPEGFVYMSNTFDEEGRVLEHHVGEQFHLSFDYQGETGQAHTTTTTDANGHTVSYQFNAEDLLTSSTDSLGANNTFSFTQNKLLQEKTDREGHSTSFEYDEKGNVLTIIDALDNRITRTYDPIFNKPLTETFKLADHTTTWTYDSKGNVQTEQNALGNTKHFSYDQHGQLLSETNFRGFATTHAYSPEGDLIATTDAQGNTTTFAYDELGRLATVTNPRSFSTSYTYDDNDNLLQLERQTAYKINYTYDKNNRLTTKTDANGSTTTYAYDHSNNLLSKTNQLDFATTYEYGPMNELTSMTSPEGKQTTYTYDPSYNLITLTEATDTENQRQTTFVYNQRRDLVTTTDSLGIKTTYTYDPMQRLVKQVYNPSLNPLDTGTDTNLNNTFSYSPTGALLSQTDPENNTTTYTYDSLDRLLSMTDAENQTNSFTYDADGNKLSATNPRGFATSYAYDKDGRLLTTTDAKGGVTSYNYDPNSNLTRLTDANSISTAFVYNPLDRLTQRIQNATPNSPSAADTNVTTQYSYDLHGNLVTLTNPRGFATTFHYDAIHRQTGITDAIGNTNDITYDKDNNIISTTDRNNHTWQYAYDELNRLISATSPENHTQSMVYDPVDNILQATNPRGKVWSYQYDQAYRRSKTTNPLDGEKTYTYDKVGNLLVLTDENDHTDRYTYDNVYRLTSFTDAEGNVTNRNYDPNSNLVKLTDAEGNPTDYAYDELDRLIAKTNAENETENYAYDPTFNLTTKTQADGTDHNYDYDPLYRLATVINNFQQGEEVNNDTNATTRYQYDANSNLITQVDANNNATQFAYDALDRLAEETNPLANTWQYQYDNETNLTQRLDAKGVATNYSYYPDNQLATIDYPEYDVKYSYSETNFPITMEDNLGTTIWGYDDLDRVISQNDSLDRNLAYAYDAVGNLTQLTYPDGRTIRHNYLKSDWLQKSQTSDQDAITISRNKVGMPTLTARSNQTAAQITYDKVYRPLEVLDEQTTGKRSLVNKFQYDYNQVGHITQETAEYGWRQPETVTTEYGYDGLHRLAQVTGDPTTAGAPNQNSRYSYDSAGNRVQMIEALKQGDETRNYSYNAANQLRQVVIDSPLAPKDLTHVYEYDANGNRLDKHTVDETGLDQGVEYAYDTENRLTLAQDYHWQAPEVEEPEPTPNPIECNGNSQGKNNGKDASDDCNNGGGNDDKDTDQPGENPEPATDSATPIATVSAEPSRTLLANTRFEYDGNGRRLVQTYHPGGSDTGKRTEYTFDRLDPVAEHNQWNDQYTNLYRNSNQDLLLAQTFKSQQAPNGTAYFYHHDGKGNISATSKSRGQSDHSYRYDEYGLILPENGNPATNRNEGSNGWIEPHNAYSLSQKAYDAHTNLVYFGSRFYDPEVGGWINQDSYRGKIQNPQSLHRYSYNYASPVNYVDWYGYCSNPSFIAEGCPGWMPDWTYTSLDWIVDKTAPHAYAPALDGQPNSLADLKANSYDDPTVRGAIADFSLGFGDVKGFKEVFTGQDLVTGETLGAERYLGLFAVSELRHVDKADDALGGIVKFCKRLFGKNGDEITTTAKKASSVWKLHPFERGREIENIVGRSPELVQNFPHIDRFSFESGVATSIKSLNLNAKTYQNSWSLEYQVQKYIDDMSGYAGQLEPWSNIQVFPNQISIREVELVIPKDSATISQYDSLENLQKYASKRGVILTIKEL